MEEEALRLSSEAASVYRISMDAFQSDLMRIHRLFERVRTLRSGSKGTDRKLQEISDYWNEGASVSLSSTDVKTLMSIVNKTAFLDHLERVSRKLMVEGIFREDQVLNPETQIRYGFIHFELDRLHLARKGQFLNPPQARQRLMESILQAQPLNTETTKVLEKLIKNLITPNLQIDPTSSAQLQEKIRREVKPIYRTFDQGKILVEYGERLTPHKLSILKAHDSEVERQFSSQSRWRQRLGTASLILMIVAIGLILLHFQQFERVRMSNREYGLFAGLIVFQMGLCRLVGYVVDNLSTWSDSLIPSLFPYALGPMLVAVLLRRPHAYIAAFLSSFLLAVMNQLDFGIMFSSLVASVVGIHLLCPLRRRSRIYEAGLFAGASVAMVELVFGFMGDVPWAGVGGQALLAIGTGIATSVLISALLPLFEALFKVTTDLRWLEWADLNHPLLRRMIMEAPGTYHHSLVVANLAERACEEIGAHALQARVCAYFHDIGKLSKPEYFCENQVSDQNPHDDIAPNMSALIIIAHVKDGIDMGLKAGMPRAVLDAIQQHHGTSQVMYFYRLAKRYEEDAKLGSKIMGMKPCDIPRVEEETYCYPGPNPQTREIGILMLADSVEGASRSMAKPTRQKIESLVRDIIEDRYRAGQLNECPLTIQDLQQTGESFVKTLMSMMHTRVSYPKDEPSTDQPSPLPSSARS
jgi:putative nucleotidyltransferase with HDIG domain